MSNNTGAGLNFVARLDTEKFKKEKAEFEKMLSDLKISTSKATGFDTKPMTEYQAGLLKLKQETLEFNKAKTEQARADRDASLATQAALKEEVRLRKEATSIKRPVDMGDSVAEAAASNSTATNGRVATSGRDEYIRLLNQDLDTGKISIADYKAEMERLNTIQAENTKITKSNAVEHKKSAIDIATEKQALERQTAALKNQAREMNAAKGSIEQRRAALIRLNTVYDNLSASERKSASGQRLEGIVGRLTTQLKEQEAVTGRAQRNVGNYTSAFTKGASKAFGALKQVANVIPGIGLAGLLAFAIDPIMDYVASLGLFKDKINQIKETRKQLNDVNLKGAQDAQTEIVSLNTLYATAKNVALTSEQRYKAAKKLQEQYPETFKNYSIEQIELGKVDGAVLRLADSIIALARARASEQKIAENSSRQLTDEQVIADERINNLAILQKLGNAERTLANLRKRAGGNTNSNTGINNDIVYTETIIADLKNQQADSDKIINSAARDREILGNRNLKLTENIVKQQQKGADIVGKLNTTTPKSNSVALNAAEALSKKLTNLHNASFRKTLSNDDAEIQAVKDKYEAFGKEAEEFYSQYGGKANLKINGKNVSKSQVGGVLKADQAAEEQAILDKRKADADKKEQEETQKHYEKLLVDFMDYGQKRAKLTKDFQNDLLLLVNDPRQQDELYKKYQKDLSELDEQNGKKLESYEKLFTGINDLSKKSALKLLENTRVQFAKDIKSGAIVDPEEIKKVNKYFDEVEKNIRSGSGQALIDLARQVDNVAAAVGGIDSAFGKVLGTLGNVIGQLGNIKASMKSLSVATGKGDLLGGLTAGLGIFGAGMSIFNSIISIFDKSAEIEAQNSYAREIQNKQTEALNKALERQIALLNDVYGTDRIKNYSEAIKTAQDNQAKYAAELVGRFALTGNKVVDDILAKANSGQNLGLSDQAILDGVKKSGLSLALPSDIKALQVLLDEGKLDANTATIVTNLIKAKETAEELVNNLRAENVGTTLSEIADDFISTLTDGTQDFGKTFEETIQKSLLNGFKGELIRKQLQSFYTQFAQLSEGGLTKTEIDTLRIAYLNASNQAKADLDALSKATGIDLSSGTGSTNSLAGAYKSASQDSINLLAGQTGGMRLAQIQTNNLLTIQSKSLGDLYLNALNSFAVLQAIKVDTGKIVLNTDRLANIEAGILAMAKSSSNYSPAQSAGGIKP
ncbi:MAG: hypothetical protein EOO42_01235 [Flavobacteriales bacterium]|nr:MAG: hypothetical protein EOO42_01235 [Flavobacteriales bacterium]